MTVSMRPLAAGTNLEGLRLEPPRIVHGRALAKNHDLLWVTALDWVARHQKLLRKILGGLSPYFPGTARDFESLAVLLAYEVIQTCLDTGSLENFTAQFCGRLRHEVISLCAGPDIDRTVNVCDVPAADVVPGSPGTPWSAFRNHSVLDQSLPYMTRRQAKVWRQYLQGESLVAPGIASREDRGIAILNGGTKRFFRKTGGLA